MFNMEFTLVSVCWLVFYCNNKMTSRVTWGPQTGISRPLSPISTWGNPGYHSSLWTSCNSQVFHILYLCTYLTQYNINPFGFRWVMILGWYTYWCSCLRSLTHLSWYLFRGKVLQFSIYTFVWFSRAQQISPPYKYMI